MQTIFETCVKQHSKDKRLEIFSNASIPFPTFLPIFQLNFQRIPLYPVVHTCWLHLRINENIVCASTDISINSVSRGRTNETAPRRGKSPPTDPPRARNLGLDTRNKKGGRGAIKKERNEIVEKSRDKISTSFDLLNGRENIGNELSTSFPPRS